MKTIIKEDLKNKKRAGRIAAAITGIIGVLLCQPFIWMMIFGEHQPYVSPLRFICVCVFVIGLPMSLYGAIRFMVAGQTLSSVSTDQSDIGRIRHAIEMERMGRK